MYYIDRKIPYHIIRNEAFKQRFNRVRFTDSSGKTTFAKAVISGR